MAIAPKLIKSGYFPKELPAVFNSVSLATAMSRNQGKLPSVFGNSKVSGCVCTHNLARPGNLCRILGIPNPIPFTRLATTVGNNWFTLEGHLKKSSFTSTRPVEDSSGERALIPFAGLNNDPQRARSRMAYRFLVRADVQNCYGSIYSHAIAWSLHGKDLSKGNKSLSLLGNALDQCTRQMNDGESTGIPIGPDTSLLIAELILTAVDLQLADLCPLLRATRMTDGYEIPAYSKQEADEYLSALQQALGYFKLRLNNSTEKTSIHELPLNIRASWIRSLTSFTFGTTAKAQQSSIIDYFDLSFDLFRRNMGDHVIQFALTLLTNIRLEASNWDLLQSLIAQAVLAEPGSIRQAVSVITHFEDVGFRAEHNLVAEVTNNVILRQAPHGHSSEVAWALSWAIQNRIKMEQDTTAAIARSSDDVVACLALDAEQKGLLTQFSPPKDWTQHLCEEGLFGPHWLLAYEANIKQWLPKRGDYVKAVEGFKFLKEEGVTFYKTNPEALLRRLKKSQRQSGRSHAKSIIMASALDESELEFY